jgi:cytochrome c oxidase subunit IV
MAHNPHSTGHHGHDDGHPLVGHLVPLSTLFATAGALLVLTVVTVAVRYVDLGEFNIWIAVGVAAVKAILVCLYFMHLRWDRPFNQLTMVGSVVFVALLMAFAMMDDGQNQSMMIRGNPKWVQEKLNEVAPEAPIAQRKSN